MDKSWRFWETLPDQILSPQVAPDEIEQCVAAARSQLPVPVFWLLGKAQSGKSSIVRALTGSDQAEVGNGFRACTRTSRIYAFPEENQPFIRFLDTRGLGEVAYDPAEDLMTFQRQAHLLLIVVKALDHAQSPVLGPAREIIRARPDWPILVAQTCLHEGYPPGQREHIQPYPYQNAAATGQVPTDLVRSLAQQRAAFNLPGAIYVPIDFTLPEDGFDPVYYGLEALWDGIETQLPLGLRNLFEQTRAMRQPWRDAYRRAAHPHILSYSLAAGLAGGVPVPWVDIPLVLGIQGKMFHTLASIYGQELSAQRVAEVGGALGLGVAARFGGRELLKFIPGFGSAVSALYAAAATYALGWTLCAYFSLVQQGDLPTPEKLRSIYAAEYAEGRKRLAELLKHSHPARSDS
jgi:uncharacterized protein (DUF697 family)